MKKAISIYLFLFVCFSFPSSAVNPVSVYRMFEASVVNSNPYANKFTDVELLVQYQAPSGRIINFRGFYDGDGLGGGNATSGNIWKMRFLPDEPGIWKYVYRWTDRTVGGEGSFECTTTNAGKGILQAYSKNPHWFAYNGTDPVWLKSYYETGHGSIGQDFDWVITNVYQKLFDHDYNHVQVNWLLSLCCFKQYYLDGPEPETIDLGLYEEGKITESMNFDVWHRMEKHLGWLNDHDMGVHMFLGIDGSKNDAPDWTKLNTVEKDFYVRYMVARLAPFANLAGWNYVWEVPGDREEAELGFARLIGKYDVFKHLVTYEDEFPRENFYDLPEYSFAAIENHQIASPEKDQERQLWRDPWTHHMACLLGYKGKPVYMVEGNALWRRFWSELTGATQDDLRRSAWACAMAASSFTWNGHAKEYELYANGPSGLPFTDDNPYSLSEKYIQILSHFMQNDVNFYEMIPADELLVTDQPLRVYAMAEQGKQYVVFAPEGSSFELKLAKGNYLSNFWLNAETGEKIPTNSVRVTGDGLAVPFQSPDKEHDWVLVLKN